MKKSKVVTQAHSNQTIPAALMRKPLRRALLCCLLSLPLTPVLADPNFTDNGDGTVTDKRTNLMWMRCVAGIQTWNGTTCVGDATKLGYHSADALKLASEINFAGHNDWYVPSIDEINSSMPYETALFPNQPISLIFWSSSAPRTAFSIVNDSDLQTISFGDATHPTVISYSEKQDNVAGYIFGDVRSVRLVRKNTTPAPAPTPAPNPTDPIGNTSTSGIFTTQGILSNASRSSTTLNLNISTSANTTDEFLVWANVNGLGQFYYIPNTGWIPIPASGIIPQATGLITSSTTNINILNNMNLSSPVFNQTKVYVVYWSYGANPSPSNYGNLIYQIGGNW